MHCIVLPDSIYPSRLVRENDSEQPITPEKIPIMPGMYVLIL